MSGRDQFARHRKLIRFAIAVLRYMPRPLRNFIWDCSRGFTGRVSLLLRYSFLYIDGCAIGDNVYVGRNVTILNRDMLTIGKNVSIHENTYIDAIGGCMIGDNVSIAHGCSIITFNHGWGEEELPIKYNETDTSAVSIGSDVWMGAGVKILQGVTVGDRVVLAAGAVIVSDVPARSIYGGVPARKLKDI